MIMPWPANAASPCIKTGIMARLLAPAQFGVFGMVALTLALAETFSETSLEQVLIQKEKLTDDYLITSWYINLLRGFSLCLILILAAPLIARFFNQPGIHGRRIRIFQVLNHYGF